MDTKGRIKRDTVGQPVLTSDELVSLLLSGKSISGAVVDADPDIDLYNRHKGVLLSTNIPFNSPIMDVGDVEEVYAARANDWLIPEKYKNMDVLAWLATRCRSTEDAERVAEEYVLFEKHDLVMLLRLFIYLRDYIMENNMLWGIGRGSSTCSHILYLIGVHKVDCIKYGLPITDYLK